MPVRLGNLLLGLLLLLQAGPTCPCAVEHTLICTPSSTNGLLSASRCCDDPACPSPIPCSQHSQHSASCSTRSHVQPSTRQIVALAPVFLDFTSLAHLCPRPIAHDRPADAEPPDRAPGSARSLPLLI